MTPLYFVLKGDDKNEIPRPLVGVRRGFAACSTRRLASEKAWNQAYKREGKALDTLLDDHIVLINDDGSAQSKTQFLSTLKVMSLKNSTSRPNR